MKIFEWVKRMWSAMMGNTDGLSIKRLASYDIIRVPIDRDVKLCGVTFHGLQDINDHVTHMHLWMGTLGDGYPKREKTNEGKYEGINIIEVFERYPCFDSYDYDNENRYYDSFFITMEEVTPELISKMISMERDGDINFVTEHILPEFLPIVYYSGEGDYMLVAK